DDAALARLEGAGARRQIERVEAEIARPSRQQISRRRDPPEISERRTAPVLGHVLKDQRGEDEVEAHGADGIPVARQYIRAGGRGRPFRADRTRRRAWRWC